MTLTRRNVGATHIGGVGANGWSVLSGITFLAKPLF
jgi:hypothetical protein